MALTVRFPAGTVGHALGHACNAVGVKRVAGALGRKASTVYDWLSPDRPQKLPDFTVEQLQIVAGMVAAKGLPHYFGLLFGGAAGAPVPRPHSPDLLHHLVYLGDLRGRTSALVCRAADRITTRRRGEAGPVAAADLTAAEQTALIDALDAEIAGLAAFRAALLTGAAAVTVPGAGGGPAVSGLADALAAVIVPVEEAVP